MILGISRSVFTLVHVLMALTAAGSGFAVVFGFLNSELLDGWISIFFTTSILTDLTGFAFPFDRLLHSHILGLLSLLILIIVVFVRIISDLTGWWRAVYVLMFATALYFDCFAGVVQLFAKIPALKAKAPTQTEPLFLVTQSVVLAVFVVLTYLATKRFLHGSTRTTY